MADERKLTDKVDEMEALVGTIAYVMEMTAEPDWTVEEISPTHLRNIMKQLLGAVAIYTTTCGLDPEGIIKSLRNGIESAKGNPSTVEVFGHAVRTAAAFRRDAPALEGPFREIERIARADGGD